MTSSKRKLDEADDDPTNNKKQKVQGTASDAIPQSTTPSTQPPPPNPQANRPIKDSYAADATPKKLSRRLRKLVPPRPWSINPSNVTGPRSARADKNYICLTRKTALGAYMRRCKGLILDDGYKTIHLSAMGAAIPHLMQLACILPDILPFPRNEIDLNVTTGSVEVQDEVLPDDLEEDVEYKTRCKSTVKVVITVGKGEESASKKQVVVEEPEQEDV